MPSDTLLRIDRLAKTFTLHMQGAARIPVLANLSLTLERGTSMALTGPSGAGKSSLLRLIYGTYKADGGQIRVAHKGGMLDLVTAPPRTILDVRRTTIGYVSQFLRVIPRVPTLDVVSEPMMERGATPHEARDRARALLARLRIPEPMWSLSPVTFSGGEQQRVNIARAFCADYPILLLDEPTASLDAENRETVLDMVREAHGRGTGIVAVFHSARDREAACTETFDITDHAGAAHG